MSFISENKFVWFVIKFLVVFLVLYYGTLAVIGVASPGNYYIPFVDKYLDYVSGIKNLLVWATKGTLYLFGIETKIEPGYLIRIINARGVFIAMDCVGYGVYSFWIAYVIANDNKLKDKIIWIIGGLITLFLINSARITLFLLAINKGWPMPLGFDHHTWFNIFAYMAIFLMMYFFEKGLKKKLIIKNFDDEK